MHHHYLIFVFQLLNCKRAFASDYNYGRLDTFRFKKRGTHDELRNMDLIENKSQGVGVKFDPFQNDRTSI